MAKKKEPPAAPTRERVVPTTFHLPESVHSALKMRAGLKGCSMVDIVIDGVRMALESDKYRLSEEEKRRLLGI